MDGDIDRSPNCATSPSATARLTYLDEGRQSGSTAGAAASPIGDGVPGRPT